MLVTVSVLDIVITFTHHACNLPVPFGTIFIFMFVLEPTALYVTVPVPQTN